MDVNRHLKEVISGIEKDIDGIAQVYVRTKVRLGKVDLELDRELDALMTESYKYRDHIVSLQKELVNTMSGMSSVLDRFEQRLNDTEQFIEEYNESQSWLSRYTRTTDEDKQKQAHAEATNLIRHFNKPVGTNKAASPLLPSIRRTQ
jgi:predicted  nucleic acid-binding Zn-ribbon protein